MTKEPLEEIGATAAQQRPSIKSLGRTELPFRPSVVQAAAKRISLVRVSLVLFALTDAGLCEARGQLELIPNPPMQCAFSGNARAIALTWRNFGTNPVEAELHTRLYQTSSATVIPLGEAPWKRLTILAGQTVVESARLDFPSVKAETRFLIKWLEGTNKVVGTTEVLVYPTNLLSELKILAGEELLGVFDPNHQLKPLLKSAGVEFSDLENAGVEDYRGKLLIASPFQNKRQIRENLAEQFKALAAKGVAVVWLQPPPDKNDALKPSYYTVPEGKGSLVIAQGSLVERLSENPQAQLNLLYLSRLALHPEPLRLPFLTPQP